ncbi:hypothetical protein MTO96_027712 [Rhipicephalus appendiculatus]
MSMHVVIDGVLTEVYPGIDVEDGLLIYVTPEGRPVCVDVTHVTVGAPEQPEDASPRDSPERRAEDPAPHGPPDCRAEELWPEARVLQLAEVLERQHLINPVYVAGAGHRRVQRSLIVKQCLFTPLTQTAVLQSLEIMRAIKLNQLFIDQLLESAIQFLMEVHQEQHQCINSLRAELKQRSARLENVEGILAKRGQPIPPAAPLCDLPVLPATSLEELETEEAALED